MHGVTALALGDSVPVEGGFPFGGIAAGFTEDSPLGKGFIPGKGEAELSEGIFDLWGFGRFRSGDDIERKIGIEFSGGEFSQLSRDDLACRRFVESAQSLNGELFLGEGRFFALEGVGEEIEGLFARIEEEKKGAGPAANLVVFVGDEGGQFLFPVAILCLSWGEEIEGFEAGVFRCVFGIEVSFELSGIDGELVLADQLERAGKNLGGVLFGRGRVKVRLELLDEIRGKLAAVFRKNAGEASDGVADGRVVPIEESGDGVAADADVDGRIIDDFYDDLEILRAGEGPCGVEGAAGAERVVLHFWSDSLGDGVSALRESDEGSFDVFIVSAADCFLANGFVGVIEVSRNFESFLAAQSDDGGAAHGIRLV